MPEAVPLYTLESLDQSMARTSLESFLLWDGKGKWTPALFHKIICEKIEEVVKSTEAGIGRRVIFMLPPQHGKALAVGTPIPTPGGWKNIEDLKPGDKVFAGDGSITGVVAVSPIWKDRPVYEVKTGTGFSVIADAAHEWEVRLDRKWKAISIRETEWLYNRTSPRSPLVKMHSGLQLSKKKLPIPPYTLGAWLGDGNRRAAYITQGEEDRPGMLKRIESEGFKVRSHTDKKNTGILGLCILLRKNKLFNNKHIPSAYLRASRKQRIALLQGLVDTDGYVSPGGQVEFCSTRKRLAEDVVELVTSLGVKCSLCSGRATLNGVDYGEKWRIMFYYSEAASLLRKRRLCKDGKKHPGNYLTFSPAGRADTVCIQVKHSDHLFLAGRGMIPTHNSEICTKKAPAWILGNHPDWGLIETSYGADLIEGFSKIARDTFEARAFIWGLKIDPKRTAVNSWGVLGHRGGLVAAGVGGAVTGNPASLLWVDDPHKNREEANSPTMREAVWEFFKTAARTRLAPGGAVIIILTRWNIDDLAGRALESVEQDESGNMIPWEVISFPAFAEEDDILGRKLGDILWPERYSLADYLDAKATLGSHDWAALYQQRPVPEGGAMFRRSWFKYFREEGEYYVLSGSLGSDERVEKSKCWRFQTCDPAATEKATSDYFCVSTWAVTPDRNLLLLDVFRERAETVKHELILTNLYDRWKPDFVGVEKVSFGLNILQGMKRTGFPVRPMAADKDKISRARMAAARYEVGAIYHKKDAPYLDDFESEILVFPSGKHDDQVDTISMAVSEIALAKSFFSEFDRELHIREWVVNEGAPILRGWTFREGKPVCVVGQVDEKDRVCLIGSISLGDCLIDEFIDKVKEGCLKKFGDKAVYRDFCGSEDASGIGQADKKRVTDVELMAGYKIFASYQELTEDKYIRLIRMLLRERKPGESGIIIDPGAEDLIRTFESGLTRMDKAGYNAIELPEKNHPWFSVYEGLKFIVAGVVNLQSAEITISFKGEKARQAYEYQRKKEKEARKFYRNKDNMGGLNG